MGLIGLAEELDEGVGHIACKCNPDFPPSLHPLPLAHIFEVSCALCLDLTMCLAWVIEWSRSTSTVILSLWFKRPCSFLCLCYLLEDMPEVACWNETDMWRGLEVSSQPSWDWSRSMDNQLAHRKGKSPTKRHRHVPSWHLPWDRQMLLYCATEVLWLFVT